MVSQKIKVNWPIHYPSTYPKDNFTFWALNWQSDLPETFYMNNKILHVICGFGNVWITLSTFSSFDSNETHCETSNVF